PTAPTSLICSFFPPPATPTIHTLSLHDALPISDASRRPAHFPLMTLLIIVINGFVFVQELLGGEAFVLNWAAVPANIVGGHHWIDRKSTRLNSSHVAISYAVFCLKKKNKQVDKV